VEKVAALFQLYQQAMVLLVDNQLEASIRCFLNLLKGLPLGWLSEVGRRWPAEIWPIGCSLEKHH
jgi:phosphoserine phosphatase